MAQICQIVTKFFIHIQRLNHTLPFTVISMYFLASFYIKTYDSIKFNFLVNIKLMQEIFYYPTLHENQF